MRVTGIRPVVFRSVTQRRIYQDAYPQFVTTVVCDRAPAFADERAALHLAEIILGACALKSYDAIAWAILPDHVHLLVWKAAVMRDMDATQRAHMPQRAHNSARCVDGCTVSPHPKRGLLCPRESPPRPRMFRGNERHSYGLDALATITDLMRTIKGTFTHDINREQFWQKRFYARIVDSDRYLDRVLTYIQYNHVKHGLPARYARWPYSYCTT